MVDQSTIVTPDGQPASEIPEEQSIPDAPDLSVLPMPNHVKDNLLPPLGTTITMVPYLYVVVYKNLGKLRFSAQLVAVRKATGMLDAQGRPIIEEERLGVEDVARLKKQLEEGPNGKDKPESRVDTDSQGGKVQFQKADSGDDRPGEHSPEPESTS